MVRIQKSLFTLLISGLGLLSSCKDDGRLSCPCNSRLYTKSHYGLGSYKIGMQDSHDPVNHCGFSYLDNHKGGIGDTLEEIGCNGDSVFFYWAYDSLDFVEVKTGWEGKTDTGLKIGDPLATFLELYPKAMQRKTFFSNTQANLWVSGHLKVNIDSEGNVDAMQVQSLDYDKFPENESLFADGVQPWQDEDSTF